MKRILLSSFVLLLFSAAIITFQLSCTKTVLANDGNGNKSNDDNAILYLRQNPIAYAELWSVKQDGTNDHRIVVQLPVGWILQPYSTARISEKNNKIIFTAGGVDQNNGNIMAFFSCNLDGSNTVKIKELDIVDNVITIQDLY
jgi:hypothetical protein